MHERTCFIVAHRLSTVHGADQILVFDQGRIVEQGRLAELIGREGLYARLALEQQQEAAGSGVGEVA